MYKNIFNSAKILNSVYTAESRAKLALLLVPKSQGRFEKKTNEKITQPQVDSLDTHKNKTICAIQNCFGYKTALEIAKTVWFLYFP